MDSHHDVGAEMHTPRSETQVSSSLSKDIVLALSHMGYSVAYGEMKDTLGSGRRNEVEGAISIPPEVLSNINITQSERDGTIHTQDLY